MDGLQLTGPSNLTNPKSGDAPGPAMPSCCPTATFSPNAVPLWLRDRRVLAGAGLVVAGSGLALGWGWLTAVGVAPLIASAAPCIVMCALGLCMMGRGHQPGSGSPRSAPTEPSAPTDRAVSS